MFENINSTHVLLFVGVIAIIIFASMYFSSSNKKEVRHVPPNRNANQPNQREIRPVDSAPRNFTLYNFFSPDCGWCKRFMPDWNKLSGNFDDIPDLALKPIDASLPQNGDLVFYYNIKAFPTIILTTPDRNIEYEGDRSVGDIDNFVRKTIAEYKK